MPLAVGGGPPRFEQVVGFLVQQLRIQVPANQLHHGLPQVLVTGESEDDVQALRRKTCGHDIGLRSGGSVGISVNVTAR